MHGLCFDNEKASILGRVVWRHNYGGGGSICITLGVLRHTRELAFGELEL